MGRPQWPHGNGQALPAAGAEVNAKNNGGDTALTLAAHNGHTETVQTLSAAGAEVNAKNNRGGTVILAAQDGHTEIVHSLLSSGAEINTKDTEYGSTALICCTKSPH